MTLDHLWAGWRSAYIDDVATQQPRDDTCLFCALLEANEKDALVLARNELVFAVLNAYPYTSGHLMLGREGDWQASTSVLPARPMLDRVAAVGFDGLVYDWGSTYHAGEPFPDDISAVLGTQPFVSRDHELQFWDLRPYRRALRARIGAAGMRHLRAVALADRSKPAH